jgi:predicted dehydrogenase
MAPNAATTACYDIDMRLAKDLAERHGAVAVPSLAALLERSDVEAVLLSLPHHLHAPVAVECARAGKHVVVEKPAANDLSSAVGLVRAVERTAVALSACFPQRYSPEVASARRILAHKGIGDLFLIELLWYADKPLSYMFGGFSGRSPSTWRMRRETSGGGILLMNFCHGLDLVRYVTGLEVESISASVANVEQVGEVEDTVVVTVEYANGALGVMAGSSAARALRHESLRILGTDGRLELRPVGRVFTSRLIDELQMEVDREVRLGRQASPLVTRSRYFTHFVSAVRERRQPEVTGEDALRVQAVIEAAYQSVAIGARVRPDDLLRDVDVDHWAGTAETELSRAAESGPTMPR